MNFILTLPMLTSMDQVVPQTSLFQHTRHAIFNVMTGCLLVKLNGEMAIKQCFLKDESL